MHGKKCPSCGIEWEQEENIYDFFKRQELNKCNEVDYVGDPKENAAKTAEMYGCTKETPKHFGKNVMGIEVRGMYDGVSFWQCQKCKAVFDRFTMKEVDKENGVL